MDEGRDLEGQNLLLGELASDAALERKQFLVEATEQFRGFLDRHADRIRELGGLVLIDEDPDYLSIAPDLTFRSRSRYQDEVTGDWVSDTEVIESAGELIELYNPADLYQAFHDAAREKAGMPEEPTAAAGLMDAAQIAPDQTFMEGEDPYAAAADDWAAAQGVVEAPDDETAAARRLYDLALTFQERSQQSEARLIEQFESSATALTERLGELIIVDDEDERLTLRSNGTFTAEVVPEDEEGTWRTLGSAAELVEFYDPTDVFGDLAEAIAENFPGVGDDGSEDELDDDEDEDDEDEEVVDEDLVVEDDAGSTDEPRRGV